MNDSRVMDNEIISEEIKVSADEIKINKLYEKIDKLSNSIPIEWKNNNSYIKYFLIFQHRHLF